jgi:hypothetical protein
MSDSFWNHILRLEIGDPMSVKHFEKLHEIEQKKTRSPSTTTSSIVAFALYARLVSFFDSGKSISFYFPFGIHLLLKLFFS